jgi:hypothetical protein
VRQTPPSRIALAFAGGAALVVLSQATPAGAFHRKTPPVTPITTSGDVNLPRVPSQGRRSLPLVESDGVWVYMPFSTGSGRTLVSFTGSQPATSLSGRTIAWRTTDGHIALAFNGAPLTGPTDASGTSDNPSVDKRGTTLAFDSAGDLGLGAAGVRRVYVRDRFGFLMLVSMGSGTSSKAMVSAKRGVVTFESTSDPTTGADTGVRQIWVGSLNDLPAARITAGAGASTDPLLSDDGRLVTFASRANLAGGGADTGVAQIFVYDLVSGTYAQLTNEPGGCSRPTVARFQSDWRITFVCGGQAYYTMLRANVRYHVPTPAGTVQAINAGMGDHFVTVSTNADLVAGSGTTAGNRIYVLNMYAAPPPSVPGSVTWFPFQGIPGF